MSEEKKERMRKISAELKNLVANAPVAPGGVLDQDSILECLKLNWAKKDSNGNFVLTDLGAAMVGRKDE